MDSQQMLAAFSQVTNEPVYKCQIRFYKPEVCVQIVNNLRSRSLSIFSTDQNGGTYAVSNQPHDDTNLDAYEFVRGVLTNRVSDLLLYANLASVFPIGQQYIATVAWDQASGGCPAPPSMMYDTNMWAALRTDIDYDAVAPVLNEDKNPPGWPFPQLSPAKASSWAPIIVVGGLAAAWLVWSVWSSARGTTGYRA